MQQVESIRPEVTNPPPHILNLRDFLILLYGYRWLILSIVLLFTIAGITGSFLFAKYSSDGFFQFGGPIPAISLSDKNKKTTRDRHFEREKSLERESERDKGRDSDSEPGTGITLANYKRFTASFATAERFAEYIKEKKLESNPAAINLHKAFSSDQGILKVIEPVYPFTKQDAKLLAEQPKGNTNNVIGLQISYSASTAEEAQQIVEMLGRYVMDSVIYLIYSDELQFKQSEITAKIAALDNEILTMREQLEEYRRKQADLKQIVSRYPESASHTARQVVSVNEESARYLSPVTQLITTEVLVSDVNKAIRKAQREKTKCALLLEYYNSAKTLLDSTKSGETALRSLASTKKDVFKGKHMENEIVQEVYNMITADTQNAINIYLEKSRFIAGPTLPPRSSAKPAFAAAASMLAGLFLSVFLVIALHWWKRNHKNNM